MRFAHFSDVHIGSWREPRLHNASTEAFAKAVDFCIGKEVDFVLIAGDLFNTSLPPIDKLKAVVSKLKQLQEAGVPVYVTAGSHDYSPSGKTMLEVLEEAGLLRNVVKGEVKDGRLALDFTVDRKTGAKIAGMIGKKGMLERSYYEALDLERLEKEPGYKIFMFHTAISELKPKELEMMPSEPVSLLPKGFDYYAGGHVHIIERKELPGYGTIAYPGALFPANFRELEQFHHGGLYLIEDGKVEWHPVPIHPVRTAAIDGEGRSPQEVEEAVALATARMDVKDAIVTLRMAGTLRQGKPSDIDMKAISTRLYERGAHLVLKNASALAAKEFEAIHAAASAEDIEASLVKEHLGQSRLGLPAEKEEALTHALLRALAAEKDEGERNSDFESRVRTDVERVLRGDGLL